MQRSPLPQSDGRHDFFTVMTLVDITKTNTVRHYNRAMAEDEKAYNIKRNKHRNWETILQVINLRAQPVFLTDSILYENQNLSEYDFGSDYIGQQSVWIFTFGSEHKGSFDINDISGGGLINDVHHVPIITGLDETAIFQFAAFDSISTAKNILVFN